jgi:hypothetical protein
MRTFAAHSCQVQLVRSYILSRSLVRAACSFRPHIVPRMADEFAEFAEFD